MSAEAIRWKVYDADAPHKTQVVVAATLGDALAAAKVIFKTKQPCAERLGDKALTDFVNLLKRGLR